MTDRVCRSVFTQLCKQEIGAIDPSYHSGEAMLQSKRPTQISCPIRANQLWEFSSRWRDVCGACGCSRIGLGVDLHVGTPCDLEDCPRDPELTSHAGDRVAGRGRGECLVIESKVRPELGQGAL